MKVPYDFKKEWPKTKKKLLEISQEALDLAKKGEERLLQLSQEGKLRLDAATLTLKKEKLFYLIGKEYVQAKCPSEKTAKIEKLLKELEQVEKQQKVLKAKLKVSKKTKKSIKSPSRKK